MSLISDMQWRTFNLSQRLLDCAYSGRYSKKLSQELLKHGDQAFQESQGILLAEMYEVMGRNIKAV